jgi:hypothetical protein
MQAPAVWKSRPTGAATRFDWSAVLRDVELSGKRRATTFEHFRSTSTYDDYTVSGPAGCFAVCSWGLEGMSAWWWSRWTEWETDADQRIPPLARSKYSLPILDNHPALVEDGVPGLLTQKGFETAYTGYQQHMIDELNASTAGTMTAVRRCTRRSKD